VSNLCRRSVGVEHGTDFVCIGLRRAKEWCPSYQQWADIIEIIEAETSNQ